MALITIPIPQDEINNFNKDLKWVKIDSGEIVQGENWLEVLLKIDGEIFSYHAEINFKKVDFCIINRLVAGCVSKVVMSKLDLETI